jgi:dTMP kinase
MKSLKPDFTFLNIVSLKNIKLRLKNRKKLNRYDKFDIRFYEKVQRGFLKILKKKKKRYMIINSDLDVDFNKKMVINKINQLIK